MSLGEHRVLIYAVLLCVLANPIRSRPADGNEILTSISDKSSSGPPPVLTGACFEDGRWYPPGAEMSRGQSGNWCYGTYCSRGGSIIPWDDWNCGTTTSPTSQPQTTERPTTVPYTLPPKGCFENGRWHRPGAEMSRGQSGSWCYGTFCSRDGETIAWDDWNCGTTPQPTTVPQHPTREPKIPTTIPPAERSTVTAHSTHKSEVTKHPRPDTVHPTDVPRKNGCFENGRWYRPGAEMSRGQSGSWCYGTYCSRDGETIAWDDWNCGTTPHPTTVPQHPATKEPTTTPELPQPTHTTAHKFYATDLGPMVKQTEKPPLNSCYHEEKWYTPGSEIYRSFDGLNWCYGARCSSDGSIITWDDFNCNQYDVIRKEPKSNQKSVRQRCWYRGEWYTSGSEISLRTARGRCFGGICDKDGYIRNWRLLKCHSDKQAARRKFQFTPSSCRYRGRLFPEGSVVHSKSLYKTRGQGWCVGAKCGINGRVIAWGPEWAPGNC